MAWTDFLLACTAWWCVCVPDKHHGHSPQNALFSNTHHAPPCIRASAHICLGVSGACMGHMGMAWTDFSLACTARCSVLSIFKGRANALLGVARFCLYPFPWEIRAVALARGYRRRLFLFIAACGILACIAVLSSLTLPWVACCIRVLLLASVRADHVP